MRIIARCAAWTKTTRSGLRNDSALPQMTLNPAQPLPTIRRAEFENHNKDGGLWLVVGGKVYDLQDFRSVAAFSRFALKLYENLSTYAWIAELPMPVEARR